MFLQTIVPVPDVPSRIVFLKRKDEIYVYFQISRDYDPKKGYTVPKRVSIGKLVDSNDRTRMSPNLNFISYFPQEAQDAGITIQVTAKAKTQAKTEADTETKAKAETKDEAEAEVQSQAKAQSKPQTNASAQTKFVSTARSNSMSDIKVVVITGDHPRHRFFAQQLVASGVVSGVVFEQRDNFVPTAADFDCLGDSHLEDLVNRHFALRELAETSFFGGAPMVTDFRAVCKVPCIHIPLDKLNSEETINFVRGCGANLVLSYGCHKLTDEFIQRVGATFWNTHGGLSPDYRGTITHFWPSYFLEPQMTGMTLHETTANLDGGGIIMQTAYEMTRGDTLHQVACRTVISYVKKLCEFLPYLDHEHLPQGVQQKGSGKLFLNSQWRPEHLRLIYDFYGDHIVDQVLDGYIQGRTPTLIDELTPYVEKKRKQEQQQQQQQSKKRK